MKQQKAQYSAAKPLLLVREQDDTLLFWRRGLTSLDVLFRSTLCVQESIDTAAVPAACKDGDGERDTLLPLSLKRKTT